MAENVYLRSLRDEYDKLDKSIQGIQLRAAEGKRDLTKEEKATIVQMGERGESMHAEIEMLSAIELRNAKTAKLAADIDAATGGGTDDGDADEGKPEVRTGGNAQDWQSVGRARTKDRDPGLYVRGGQYSFIGDQYRAKHYGDAEAASRLTKHTNALRDDEHLRDVLGSPAGTSGSGLVPPVWLADQFAEILHRRLRVAAKLRRVPWSGPYPWTIPVAVTASNAVLSTSQVEGQNPAETDPAYTTVTVIPQTITGMSEVSRQLLEGSNPAVDALIWGDMIGAFYDGAESNTITAIESAANINLVTVADGSVSAGARAGVLDAIGAVEDNGGGDADLFFSRRSRWHQFLKFTDTAGRPLVVNQSYGPGNVVGLGNAVDGFRDSVVGELEALSVVTTPTANSTRAYVINTQELLFSVSNPMQFSFEQPAGPALIRVGVWGYMAAVANRRPKSIARITFTTQ